MVYIACAIIVSAVILYGSWDVVKGDSKRLLMTDPDVLANRILKLENTVSLLQNDNDRMDKLIKQQADTIISQSTKIQQLDTTVTNQKLTNSVLSTYTIWGRTGCPNNSNTELVYSGYVGGGIYSNAGSSQDILCMTQNPTFGKKSSFDFGRIYGAEYDNNFYGPNSDGEDMPCAVCMRKSVSKSIMIPGRNTCHGAWFVEYHGYLASQYHSHASGTNYICVAENPEFLVAGAVNTNAGKLFGPVVAKCGTLKCPRYHDNYPITCVVCSK